MAATDHPTFQTPNISIERRDDGAIIMRSNDELPPYPDSIIEALRRRAAEHPDRILATQLGDDGQRIALTYGEARAQADALAQAFIDRELGPDRPVMVLSGNSLEHLVVSLGAHTAGVPVLPISVAYSLLSTDHARLRAIVEKTAPGLAFADDADSFCAALDAIAPRIDTIVTARGHRSEAQRLDDLLATEPTSAVDERFATVGPDTVTKLLFTSGSTGVPKGVINTNRMMSSNQAAIRYQWPFLREEPPVLLDWLPWSHTFGANHNVNMIVLNGGTLHIDAGRPAPLLFEKTVAALRETQPTIYLAVPASYAMLAPVLEQDRELAEHFFSRMRLLFYGAASLPGELALRLKKLGRDITGDEIPLTSGWGATETAPLVTSSHFPAPELGCIGVPLPGMTLKLAPVGSKFEARVRGPNVTPGYFKQPDLTAAAFDEDGFFRTGDACVLVDENDPSKGVLFDGRIAEDFKLVTGTWVRVGNLRNRLLGLVPLLSNVVIAGQDQEFVTVMGWINDSEARKLLGTDDAVALDDPVLRDNLSSMLAQVNLNEGSASRIQRLLLLAEPPSLDAGEITDKGSINQRVCLDRRADDVALLYADEPDPVLIVPAD